MSLFSGTSNSLSKMHSRLFFSCNRLDYAILMRESRFLIPKNMFLRRILSFLKMEVFYCRFLSMVA